jgi:hypothetical protein
VLHVLILPLKTSVSPPIDFITGEEHCAVISETSIVLDNKGSMAVVKVMLSVLMLLYIVMNMIRVHGAWKSMMMMLLPTTVEGSRKSRACQFLPLLRATKATEMAN